MDFLSLKPHGWAWKSFLLLTLCVPSFSETVAEPPVVIPAQKAEPQDRKDGAGMAAGLAAMGAAVAGMSCLELYRQAREIEPVDPGQAAQLRAMAAMQCSQAAQSAADAAKNQDSKERLSLNDTPTGMNPAQTPSPQSAEPKNPFSPQNQFEPETAREIADATEFKEPEPAIFEPKVAESSLGIQQNASARGDSLTKLSPIEPSILGVNEGNGSSMAAANANPSPNFGFPSASANSTQQKAANGEIKEPEGLLRKKPGAAETLSPSSNTEDATSEGRSDESSASSVLARLLGGGGEGSEALLGGQIAGIDVPHQGATTRSANIFEYASYRMKKSRVDGEIKIGKAKLTANFMNRSTTAVTP